MNCDNIHMYSYGYMSIKRCYMDELNNFFKALSDQTRMRIMIILYHHDLYVCEMAGILDLPQPKVSKHLTKLRDLGFVKDSRKEKYISYTLNLKDPVMKKIIETLACETQEDDQIRRDIERIGIRNRFECCCTVPKPE